VKFYNFGTSDRQLGPRVAVAISGSFYRHLIQFIIIRITVCVVQTVALSRYEFGCDPHELGCWHTFAQRRITLSRSEISRLPVNRSLRAAMVRQMAQSHAPRSSNQSSTKAFVARALAFVAGIVDITGYISFGQMFTAHLTGDTVHLGQNLLEQQWSRVAEAAIIILTFIAGSLVGRIAIEIGARRKAHSIAAASLVLEAGLLSAVIPLRAENQLLLLGLLAAAMGVQTATLTRVGPLTIHTTFVTGMLNKLAQLLSHAMFLTYDLFRGSESARNSRSQVLRDARFIFSIWFLYLLGAIIGTWAQARWSIHALLPPICLLVGLAAFVHFVAPLSLEEEREAFER
jgi:uncharacterized membrane protein YoaK (UPF0700 family)